MVGRRLPLIHNLLYTSRTKEGMHTLNTMTNYLSPNEEFSHGNQKMDGKRSEQMSLKKMGSAHLPVCSFPTLKAFW
ncbi:hypothetical protein POVCU2_0009020 [Plasmodium ovale curtisi]|uniref:Uncharacterized protein n=1 Tax=Plasmodium ovale curtisi TaxID=864141 RepID=A0A1A8VKV0_PLAOA|nr:hypothetical protein POVCU2_0009020 [Plasmodium ovale curtisi]SBS82601.1 hypothetical protein POVCU1_008090 [Plasmodium ovale curtisi]